MRQTLTRREVLHRSLQWGAAAGLAAALPRFASAQECGKKILVTSREVMFARVPEPVCWNAMKAVGIDGLELMINDKLEIPGLRHPDKKYTIADAAAIKTLMDDVQAAGLRITALAMSNHFDERPDFEVEWCQKVAEAAKAMGVSAVRIDVVSRKVKGDEFLPFAIDVLKRTLAATASAGVKLGIENHGKTTNDPQFLSPLLAGVGSDRLGLTLDTGNFYWFGHPLSKVYEFVEQFASRVFHTHCKSIRYPAEDRDKQREMGWRYKELNCPIHEGDIDYARVVAILKKVGYTNDMCIEDESLSKYKPEEVSDVLKKEVQLLRSVC
jgi:sugar phosphate isomerase/epimerase